MIQSKFLREHLLSGPTLRPVIPAAMATERDFAIVALFCVFCGWVGDRLVGDAADEFTWSALGAYATLIALARVGGALAARLLGRDAIALSIATTTLFIASVALPVIDAAGNPEFGDFDPDYGFGVMWMLAAPLAAFGLLMMFRSWVPQAAWWRRIIAGVALPLVVLLANAEIEAWSSFYYRDEGGDVIGIDEELLPADAIRPIDVDSEDLLAVQDALVDRDIAALRPQRPGHVDMYLVALAGAATEDVFRKEAEFVSRLFDTRYDSEGHRITLVNHPETVSTRPMATLRNLRRTLDAVGRAIDPAEDIVFLFMTSHGSEDHQWAVDLADLPLRQIEPNDLASALDSAGIRWRVAVISACYSGGFVDALAGSTSLVITASRADRTSFGCHAEADMTYFGRAYFEHALRASDDFVAAHALASVEVKERESKEGFLPSEPQLREGKLIGAKLAEWRAQNAVAPAATDAR